MLPAHPPQPTDPAAAPRVCRAFLGSRSQRHGRRGQALVELAIILPLMLLLLAGAIDLGRAFYLYIGMQNAAREGAAHGMANPAVPPASIDEAAITSAARAELGGDPDLDVDVECAPDPDCVAIDDEDGNLLTVTVSHDFNFVMPLIPDLTLRTSSSAVFMLSGA